MKRPTRAPMCDTAWAWTDGSNGRSAGHSGAAGYVIADAATKEILEESVELFPHPDPVNHRFTSNDMEMTAVYLCLQGALRLGVHNLKIHSDSEWTVCIITEVYKLKQVKFQSLLEDIYRVASEFASIEIVHIRREMNKRADHLCSKATGQPRTAQRTPSITWTTRPV